MGKATDYLNKVKKIHEALETSPEQDDSIFSSNKIEDVWKNLTDRLSKKPINVKADKWESIAKALASDLTEIGATGERKLLLQLKAQIKTVNSVGESVEDDKKLCEDCEEIECDCECVDAEDEYEDEDEKEVGYDADVGFDDYEDDEMEEVSESMKAVNELDSREALKKARSNLRALKAKLKSITSARTADIKANKDKKLTGDEKKKRSEEYKKYKAHVAQLKDGITKSRSFIAKISDGHTTQKVAGKVGSEEAQKLNNEITNLKAEYEKLGSQAYGFRERMRDLDRSMKRLRLGTRAMKPDKKKQALAKLEQMKAEYDKVDAKEDKMLDRRGELVDKINALVAKKKELSK